MARAIDALATQIQIEIVRLHIELEEQLQTTSANSEALDWRLDEEIVALYS